MTGDMQHNPNYPDCPLWMRISDMPKKANTNTQATKAGHRPVNERLPWYLYEDDLVKMLNDGLTNREIAEELNLPLNDVTAKIHRLVQSGEYVPNTAEE